MSDAVAPQDTPKKSFKLVATFVLAMKRFQAALNPTYTRGKRPEDDVPVEGAQVTAMQGGSRRTTSDGRSASGRTISGRDIGVPGSQHGHKGHLLFRSLPERTEA